MTVDFYALHPMDLLFEARDAGVIVEMLPAGHGRSQTSRLVIKASCASTDAQNAVAALEYRRADIAARLDDTEDE